MNAAGAGFVLLVSCLAVIVSVFVSVLAVVSMVKVLQVAEDLRYMRSKTDLSVNRPKSYKNTLTITARHETSNTKPAPAAFIFTP